jgi:lambda repressor-like predicted transcriptional regulator
LFLHGDLREDLGLCQRHRFPNVSLMSRPPGVRHHGPSIRAWREQRGWTVDELARRSGYSRSGLSNVELETKPTIPRASLYRLADALTVDPAVLLRDPVAVAASGHQVTEKGAA